MSDNPTPAPGDGDAGGATSSPALPTMGPITSRMFPSVSPTTMFPSAFPSQSMLPTQQPSDLPTGAPSNQNITYQDQRYFTQLFVLEIRKMNAIETAIFEGILESQTKRFGLMLGEPFINTDCTILQQIVATKGNSGTSPSPGTPPIRRNMQQEAANSTSNRIVLQVAYWMNWTSRYGYEEIYQYPELFRRYMNTNATNIHDGFQDLLANLRESFVDEVGNTDFIPDDVEIVPPSPTATPTVKSEVQPTAKPSVMATISLQPSAIPSSMPSLLPPPITPVPPVGQTHAFLVGILVAASVVILSAGSAVFYTLHRRKQLRQPEEGNAAKPSDFHKTAEESANGRAIANSHDGIPEIITPVEVQLSHKGDVEVGSIRATGITLETADVTRQTSSSLQGSSVPRTTTSDVFASNMAQTGVFYPTIDSMISHNEVSPLDYSGENADAESSNLSTPRGTFMGANLLMENRSESMSTNSFDGTLSSHITYGEGDEFDKYKNSLLENLRADVESAIDGVDGMLSLAITSVFMDTERDLDLSWVGGEDLGSIEASCLCLAFEWKRKDGTSTEYSFFEDILNKIVFIVHNGLIRPNDGGRILHACASIVGLPLLKELPNTTLTIQGLIKSNELAQGRGLLVEAFSPFGDIVDASIAPLNRGFGFVRFVQPKSIDDVLKRHRLSEIEIQNVAITIKAL